MARMATFKFLLVCILLIGLIAACALQAEGLAKKRRDANKAKARARAQAAAKKRIGTGTARKPNRSIKQIKKENRERIEQNARERHKAFKAERAAKAGRSATTAASTSFIGSSSWMSSVDGSTYTDYMGKEYNIGWNNDYNFALTDSGGEDMNVNIQRYWSENDSDQLNGASLFAMETTAFANTDFFSTYMSMADDMNFWTLSAWDEEDNEDFIKFVTCRRRRSSVRRRGVIRRRGLQGSGGVCVTVKAEALVKKVIEVCAPDVAAEIQAMGETDVAGMIAKAVETLKNHPEAKSFMTHNLAKLGTLSEGLGGEEGMRKLMKKIIGDVGYNNKIQMKLPGFQEKAVFEAAYAGPSVMENTKYGVMKLCIKVDVKDGKGLFGYDTRVNYDTVSNSWKTTVEGEGAHPALMSMGALGLGLAKTINLSNVAMQAASAFANLTGMTNLQVGRQIALHTAEQMNQGIGLDSSNDPDAQMKDKMAQMEKKFWSAVTHKVAMDKGEIKAVRKLGLAHSTAVSFKSWDTDKTWTQNLKDVVGSLNLKASQQMYNKLTVNGIDIKKFRAVGISLSPAARELNIGYTKGVEMNNGAVVSNSTRFGFFNGGVFGLMTSSTNSMGAYKESQMHNFKSAHVNVYGGWNTMKGRQAERQINKHFGSVAEKRKYYKDMKKVFDNEANRTGDVAKAQAALNKAVKNHPITKSFNAKATGRRNLLGGRRRPPPRPPPPPPPPTWRDYKVPALPQGNKRTYMYGTDENPMNKQLVTRILMDRQQRKQALINVNTQDNTAFVTGSFADLYKQSEDDRNGGIIVGASENRQFWNYANKVPGLSKPSYIPATAKNYFLKDGDFIAPKKAASIAPMEVYPGEGLFQPPQRRRYLNCLKFGRLALDSVVNEFDWKNDGPAMLGLEKKPFIPMLPSDMIYSCKKYDDSLPDSFMDESLGFENGCMDPKAVPAGRRRSMLDSYTSVVKRSESRSSRRSLQADENRRSLQTSISGMKYPYIKASTARMNGQHGGYSATRCMTYANGGGSMCHSNAGTSKYLEMQYSKFYYFTDAIVLNRSDCCWNRFRDFEITAQGIKCFSGDGNSIRGKSVWPCTGLGYLLRITMLYSSNNYLNLQFFGGKGVKAPSVDGTKAILSSRYTRPRCTRRSSGSYRGYWYCKVEDYWHRDYYEPANCLKMSGFNASRRSFLRRSLHRHRRRRRRPPPRPPPPPPPAPPPRNPPPQPNWNHTFPCHSKTESSSVDKWLEVKYSKLYDFYGAIVQNRHDCCQDRFKDFEILMDGQMCALGNAMGKAGFSSFLCKIAAAKSTRTAKSVKIVLFGVDQLNLRYLGGVGYPTIKVDGSWEGLGWGVQESVKVSAETEFNRDCYTARYSDLRHMNATDAKKHFLDHGIFEGRNGACMFDCKCYLNRYSDLKGAFGTNCDKGFTHWKNHGIKEGRTGDCRFQCDCYLNKYADLLNAFGNNCTAAMDHWLKSGMKEGRSAWCTYKAPGIAKKSTPYSNGCVTSDSLKNVENDYISKVGGSQQIEAWKGQATVYNDGLSTGDASAQCGYRDAGDPKYSWNTQTAFVDGKESCVYSQCALGTNTYLAGGAITKKPDVSSGCSYYHTGQFPFDPQTCSELNIHSPQEREDCRIDSFGSGGYNAHTCQCLTNTTCPSGRTETS